MAYIRKTTYRRASLGDDGDANKQFLTSLHRQGAWHPVTEGCGIALQQGDL